MMPSQILLFGFLFTLVSCNPPGVSEFKEDSLRPSTLASAPTISYSGATGTSGTVGVAMSVTPTTLNNNGAAITNCTASPALPAWASINSTTCVISGTPTGTLTSTSYTVTATNSVGSNSGSVTLTVAANVPLLSYSGATGTSGNAGVGMSITPTTLSDRGAAITGCSSSPALPSGLSINSTTCVISGTPVGALAATTYSITASNSAGNSSLASVTLSACPVRYASVPANTSLGVSSSFCVAQFEMRCVGTSCPTGTPGTNAVASSQAAGVPWATIRRPNSKTACTNLNAINGFTNNYDLISNPEWMTIAYEIEKTAANWSSGTVGTGMLNRGHSDSSAGVLGITDQSNPYIGTGNNSGQAPGSGWEQKRTHTLSNGQVIWDFAGNTMEWINWSLGGVLTSAPSCTGGELPGVSCAGYAAADYLPDNPAGAANYNSTKGLGTIFGGSGIAPNRGGVYNAGAGTGVFALRLDYSDINNFAWVGFRCVFRP